MSFASMTLRVTLSELAPLDVGSQLPREQFFESSADILHPASIDSPAAGRFHVPASMCVVRLR